MPSILNLKFKGNKSFVAFSNLNDTESLTKTWKVCTKVASYLEQGQRLENLSWRLWHLQNLMVDTDNAKSKREFKKLSKCMGDKLDKEKGRSIEELEAPDFKRNHSTDMIRQRAVEKERNREASQNTKPGLIKRMQFTFSVDQPTPANNYPVKKPDLKPSPEFTKRSRVRAVLEDDADDMVLADDEGNDKDPPLSLRNRVSTTKTTANQAQSLRFPTLFSNDFGPSALLYPSPTLTTPMNYGEGLNGSSSNDGFSIMRPTIELPLDELLNNVDSAESPDSWNFQYPAITSDVLGEEERDSDSQDIIMQPAPLFSGVTKATVVRQPDDESSNESDEDDSDNDAAPLVNATIPPISQAVKEILSQTVAPSKVNSLYGTRANTPTGRPTLTVRTQTTPITRSSGPGATATSLNPAVLRNPPNGSTGGNSAPGGVKAECSNCGATHTPLWRRGLNDELNCNACGLYCKLHKRPRPKSMRSSHGHGESRAQAAPRQEAVDVMGLSLRSSTQISNTNEAKSFAAQCYNCHTTATPLWRKDDEGKTVCNACGLYYKLHGSARPISMKSDVIRKRSRHDARRVGHGAPDTPSASPGVSRRTSPVREASPTLAPDSTTQMTYGEDSDYQLTQSELLGALGPDSNQGVIYQNSSATFPGPYHPDYLTQMFSSIGDALPFATQEASDPDPSMSPRSSKRRRMSTDSASEPPSSAVSYSSYNDGYSTSGTSATSHSQRSSMEFPFSSYPHTTFNGGNSNSSSTSSNSGPVLRGSRGDMFWHQGRGDNSPQLLHPPMCLPEESPMDFLHPPMLPPDDDSLFSAYLHPPMTLPEDSSTHSNSYHYTHEYTNDHAHYDASMRAY